MLASMGKHDQTTSVIGQGSSFSGRFYVDGDLKIEGNFEGDVRTNQTITIEKAGKVKTTKILARNVVVKGLLIGDINSRESIRLEGSGKMLGDISTPDLIIDPGVIYKGNVEILGDIKKDPKQYISHLYQDQQKKTKHKSATE